MSSWKLCLRDGRGQPNQERVCRGSTMTLVTVSHTTEKQMWCVSVIPTLQMQRQADAWSSLASPTSQIDEFLVK